MVKKSYCFPDMVRVILVIGIIYLSLTTYQMYRQLPSSEPEQKMIKEGFDSALRDESYGEVSSEDFKDQPSKINKQSKDKLTTDETKTRHKSEKCGHTTFDDVKDKIQKDKDTYNKKKKDDKCTTCTGLLPVMDPMFNMREMCKQIILLEDHLFQKDKRCHDCICKHFLTIEALAEEAVTLDKDNKYPELKDFPTRIRSVSKKYLTDQDDKDMVHSVAGQELRKLRKSIMQKAFKHF